MVVRNASILLLILVSAAHSQTRCEIPALVLSAHSVSVSGEYRVSSSSAAQRAADEKQIVSTAIEFLRQWGRYAVVAPVASHDLKVTVSIVENGRTDRVGVVQLFDGRPQTSSSAPLWTEAYAFSPEGSRAEIVPGVLQHLRASVEYQAQGTHATSLAIVRRATSVAIIGGAVTDGRSDKHESDLVRTTAQNWFASWGRYRVVPNVEDADIFVLVGKQTIRGFPRRSDINAFRRGDDPDRVGPIWGEMCSGDDTVVLRALQKFRQTVEGR